MVWIIDRLYTYNIIKLEEEGVKARLMTMIRRGDGVYTKMITYDFSKDSCFTELYDHQGVQDWAKQPYHNVFGTWLGVQSFPLHLKFVLVDYVNSGLTEVKIRT